MKVLLKLMPLTLTGSNFSVAYGLVRAPAGIGASPLALVVNVLVLVALAAPAVVAVLPRPLSSAVS